MSSGASFLRTRMPLWGQILDAVLIANVLITNELIDSRTK